MGEVTTATVASELPVGGQGVRDEESAGGGDVIAGRGQSALQETPGGPCGKEVHGADPACLEELSKHGAGSPPEGGPAGRHDDDTGHHRDLPGSAGGEGGQTAAEGGDAAEMADGEEMAATDPETDAGQILDTESQIKLEAQKQAHRLSPEFPEALYELLCTLQEGRRLNDQRCSFRLEPVIFSSMTSLQREEFFDQVAIAQARRLDDQRAQLQGPQIAPIIKAKGRSFRGSLKQLSILRKPPQPAPVPKEDLYNMILSTQAQGRLEDQRSRAPGPMDDEDFFSLLLKVQGGRMEEQRTEFPQLLLQT
ncbi:hypothetical protein CRUP_000881 [Coryphaenoides rupestris]|nr:hypothetical protein CRUP_000881 [Coryphaenoides rupestris]